MKLRDRRAVLWGAVIVGAAALSTRVVPVGVRAAGSWKDTLRERQETLLRTRALLTALPHLKDSLADLLPKVVALAPDVVEGRSPAEATASLTSLVGFAASRHGLRVVRMDPLADSSVGAFGRVSVHVELEGDVAGLTRLLRVTEAGEPLLTFDALSVDARDRSSRREAPEVLRVAVTIAAFYLRGHDR